MGKGPVWGSAGVCSTGLSVEGDMGEGASSQPLLPWASGLVTTTGSLDTECGGAELQAKPSAAYHDGGPPSWHSFLPTMPTWGPQAEEAEAQGTAQWAMA